MVITDYHKIDQKKWEDFVFNHPRGNIFHTPEMINVYEKTKNYYPVVLFAIQDQEIVGVISGVIQKEYKGLLGYLTSRCIVLGGPLVKNDNQSIIDGLLKSLVNRVNKKSIYVQFRNLFDMKQHSQIFINQGFHYEQHLDILIDLKKSFDILKTKIHKSRRRNYSKSLNKGVVIKNLISITDIQEGYKLMQKNYKRIKLPFPDYSLFKSLAEILIPKGFCLSYGIYFNSELIGFRIALTYKNSIYDYYAGSSSEHSNKYPNDVLVLELLKYGCDGGYTFFDFGGAGKPDEAYGVRDHKLKFGGELVEYGRFVKINNKIIYNLGLMSFRAWRFIKAS
jgi:lipid II:glycine glycyltransferase (peptidoglycan interpeptide bridge formation enzyme)